MTDKDQKMLQSALWHISNSVTNGKSQTAECEITKWLKEKFNSLPNEQPSEDLKKAADCYLESIQPTGFMEGDYDGSQICDAFIAGADLQKEKDSEKFFSTYIASYYDAYADVTNDFKKSMEEE